MSLLVVVRNDERAEALLRWAVNFADGNFEDLYVLDCRESDKQTTGEWESLTHEEFPEVEYIGVLQEIDALERVAVHYMGVQSPNAYASVMEQQRALKPKLLMMDRNIDKDSDFEARYITRLLNDVHCAVMVVRLGSTDGQNSKVLIPCAGGPHSRRALQIVQKSEAIESTAFIVEPDVDEVSLDVGYRRLQKIISRAGIEPNEINQKAVIAENISKSIIEEVEANGYGMLLIGATDGHSLKRKLFGTLSDRFLHATDGTAVAVIRNERPMGHKMRQAVESFLSLRTPQLQREERVALFADIEDKSRWSFDFAVLMVLATSIASLGLLADSGAVVIGAMLVAPLMTPLLGGGLALVQGNWPLWKRCQMSVLLGFFSALAIGMVCGVVAKVCGMHLTGELAARGNPTALDLGVAFVSGLAASYCLARPKLSSALAGVAIAAALVPPIATTGICIVLGEFDVVRGSALLFGTNVVAIVFGSGLNFYGAGVRGRSGVSGLWSRRLFIVFALLCVGLAVPLTSSLLTSISGNEGSLAKVNTEISLPAEVVQLRVEGYRDGKRRVRVIVESGSPLTEFGRNQVVVAVKSQYKGKVSVIVETRLVSLYQ